MDKWDSWRIKKGFTENVMQFSKYITVQGNSLSITQVRSDMVFAWKDKKYIAWEFWRI